MAGIAFKDIEEKWQQKWAEAKIFKVVENSKKKKFYCLEFFPYPSASFLHMGHVRNYSMGDVIARFKRMQGFNVLYPMGYDSFGLPAENAAKKEKIHPKVYTENAIKKIMEAQKALGNSYDWSRVIATHRPEYYKWNQYFFLKFLEKGLAYRKKAPVNFCPNCNTVLADEEVESGKCWRCETEVELKELDQWFLKTTAYADELLEDLDKLDWSDQLKGMQRNWIGKSKGVEINFKIPTTQNFILLHGFTGSPDENFFPWLKKELKNKGYRVSAPKLPNTQNPTIVEQVEYVLKTQKFDANTVLLGHSLGAVVALKIVEQLKTPIKKLILAAGFIEPKFKDHSRPFEKSFNWKFDFDKIKKNVNEVSMLRASNDYAVPQEQADKIQRLIGGRIIDFKAEDEHICGNKEPVVLDNCLESENWPIFTTRPDTIFGVTFMVISGQHPKLAALVKGTKYEKKVLEFSEKCKKAKAREEIELLAKEGVFTGKYAENPLTGDKVPVWAGNFVVADYGSGMVMAVPAHDQRDFEFATKYEIPIKIVIRPKESKLNTKQMDCAFVEEGILVDSGKFTNIRSIEAIEKISDFIEKSKFGHRTTNYKLRDWLISRQRYWGTPIPIIYCEKCGAVPVPEKELPVLLPEDVKFTGTGNPLLTSKTFVNIKCPKCKGPARRETDTMGGFMDSSWYFLRFCSPQETKTAFDKAAVEYWMPINQYIGGIEHAVGHLIYARFFTKALRDLDFLKIDEPFSSLFNQGIVYKDGKKMSKSFGNIVTQDEISSKYGIDTARLFLLFLASPEKQVEWNDEGIEGMSRFVRKVIALADKLKTKENNKSKSSEKLEHYTNKAIKAVTDDIENFRFNLAIIKLTAFANYLEKEITKDSYEALLKLLSPFAPHTTEELWHQIGNKSFISVESWPKADEKKIDDSFEFEEKLIGNIISDARDVMTLANITKPKKVIFIIADDWKADFLKAVKTELEKTRNPGEIMKKIMANAALKRYGADISKLVPKLVADPGRIPAALFGQKEEIKIFLAAKQQLEAEISCKIGIIAEKDAKHPKAKQAFPGKPAIVIE